MRFTMICRHVGETETWEEPYERDEIETEAEARAWATATMDRFNATLSPKEQARELVSVRVDLSTLGSKREHDWEKTNLVTLRDNYGLHDTYQCLMCGITGKAYGLGRDVHRDSKYRAQVYARCDTAQAHLEKRGHPR